MLFDSASLKAALKKMPGSSDRKVFDKQVFFGKAWIVSRVVPRDSSRTKVHPMFLLRLE